MRLFLKFFGFLPFDIFQHNGSQKIPKGPPFTIFGTVTLFKNLIKNILRSPKGLSLFFFQILQLTGVSQSPKGPLFTILSLRYSADFGRSRLVLISSDTFLYSSQ